MLGAIAAAGGVGGLKKVNVDVEKQRKEKIAAAVPEDPLAAGTKPSIKVMGFGTFLILDSGRVLHAAPEGAGRGKTHLKSRFLAPF